MKIKFEGFEVEIKAKNKGANRFNEFDTLMVLDRITTLAEVARIKYKELNFISEAKDAELLAVSLKNQTNR